ncbi:MAG: mechanosensitive ion channel family protein [Pyrinomonadaceae bacterium]
MDAIANFFKTIFGKIGSSEIISAVILIAVAVVVASATSFAFSKISSKILAPVLLEDRKKLERKIRSLVFVSILFLGVIWAIGLLNITPKSAEISISLIETFLTFYWFNSSRQMINMTVDSLLRSSTPNLSFVTQTTAPIVKNVSILLLLAVATYAIFVIWDINVTAWIASAGIAGLAASLAAKDALANIFGGIAIFADKPFQVGDFIRLSTGERGSVTAIGLRSTRLLTRDSVEISIPNALVSTNSIINETIGGDNKYRIHLRIWIPYGFDIDEIESILLKVADENERVCSTPTPRCRLRSFDDTVIHYTLLCWVTEPEHAGGIKHELNRKIYKYFSDRGIVLQNDEFDLNLKTATGDKKLQIDKRLDNKKKSDVEKKEGK